MKKTFILDECVIILAQKGEDEEGNNDLSATKAVIDIIHNCHIIAYNREIYRKYSQHIDSLKSSSRPMKALNVLNVFKNAMQTEGKTKFVAQTKPLSGEHKIHNDDIYLVRLTAEAKGILVTTDNRLIDMIKEAELDKRYGFKAVSPSQVPELLQQIP